MKGMNKMNVTAEQDALKVTLVKNIHRLMAKQNMNRTALVKKAKMGHELVTKILDGKVLPAPDKINAIADALGVDVDEFYK